MKSLSRLLIIAILVFVGANSAAAQYLGIVDSDSTKRIVSGIKRPIKADGTSADADSVWVFCSHTSTAVDTFSTWTRSTSLTNATFVSQFTAGAHHKQYQFSQRVDSLLRIDTAPTPDTAYQGVYTITVTMYAGGEGTETVISFEWYRNAYWPFVVRASDTARLANVKASDTVSLVTTVTRADSLGHGATHAIASHFVDTTTTKVTLVDSSAAGTSKANALVFTATGAPNVRVTHWGGGGANDTVKAASDSGTYVIPRVDMWAWVGKTPSPLSAAGYVDGVVQEWADQTVSLTAGSLPEVGLGTGVIQSSSFTSSAITATVMAQDAIGSSELASSAAVEIVDSLLNRKMKDYRGDVTPDTTIGYVIAEMHDSLDTQGWAATGAGGGGGSCSACGSGGQTDTIFVVDTSGTNAYVALAEVRVYNSSGVFQNIWGKTDGNGKIVFNLATSTTYLLGTQVNGYTFPTRTITTGSGATYTDSTMGYDVSIGAPASAHLCRIYAYVKYPDNTAVPNATLKATPDQSNTAVADGSTVLLPQPTYSAPTDSNGLTYIDLWQSSHVRYQSSDSTFKYNIGVLAPNDKADGAITETLVRKRIIVPDSTSMNVTYYLNQ